MIKEKFKEKKDNSKQKLSTEELKLRENHLNIVLSYIVPIRVENVMSKMGKSEKNKKIKVSQMSRTMSLCMPGIQNDVWSPTDSKNIKNIVQNMQNHQFPSEFNGFPLISWSELHPLKQVAADMLTAGPI